VVKLHGQEQTICHAYGGPTATALIGDLYSSFWNIRLKILGWLASTECFCLSDVLKRR